MAGALTTTQLFDTVAIRIDGPKAWNEHFAIAWHLTDEDQRYRMELSNGALVHWPTHSDATADVAITLSHADLVALLTTGHAAGADIEGDAGILVRLTGLLAEADPNFAVVTP